MVVFDHKQVISDLLKHCILTVATDGSENLLINCFKPNQACAASLDRLGLIIDEIFHGRPTFIKSLKKYPLV